MINHQWLELPISRTIFRGPKDFRAIDVQMYAGDDNICIIDVVSTLC